MVGPQTPLRSTEAWPLVGRDAELGSLRDALLGELNGYVVRGEPGLGKTRLLRELANECRRAHVDHEWVSGTSTAHGISFGAMAHLVPVGTGVPDLHGLLHEALASLEDRGATERLVLFVDDAHLLDDASASLLHLIASRSRIRVFATVREGERTPDAVVALWKDSLLGRIDLVPLNDEHTVELIAKVVPGGLSPELTARLGRLSGGNPLFLHELVELLQDPRRTRGLGGALASSGTSGAGARLREVVEARIGLLDPESFDALELIAVGESLPTQLVGRLMSMEVLERLERRKVVQISSTDSVSTAHPIFGEVIRAGVGSLRRRALLRRLADASDLVEQRDPIRVASWRIEAGDRDPRIFLAGAREALDRLDHVLAERFARAAMETIGLEDPQAGLVLAEALVGQGRSAEAETVLAAVRPDTDEALARVGIMRAANLYRGLRRRDAGLEVLKTTELSVSAAEWRAECRSVRSMLLLQSRRDDEALELATAVLGDPDSREPARLRAMTAAASLWMHRGLSNRVLEVTPDSIARAGAWRHEVPLIEVELTLVMLRFWALMLAGRLLEAQQYADEGVGLAARQPSLRAVLSYMKGAAALGRGRAADAVDAFGEAADGLEHNDWFGLRRYVQSFRAVALVMCGDVEAARELIDAELALPDGVDHRSRVPYDLAVAAAWIAAAEGRLTQAVEDLREAATRARTFSAAISVSAFHDVVRLGCPEAVVEDLRRLASALGGGLPQACLGHAVALAETDPEGLVVAAADLEGLGALLLAAEAYSQARVVYAGQGRHGFALGAEHRCDELLAPCGNPRSPVIGMTSAQSPPLLTPREKEMAFHVAAGLSNADLADRLHLSVNTVHTHLTRIYRKLGVSGRPELIAQLGPRGAG
ncbi:MAG: helix-turn-helix transcriptional regulator [Acidimicrobiales bacterium]